MDEICSLWTRGRASASISVRSVLRSAFLLHMPGPSAKVVVVHTRYNSSSRSDCFLLKEASAASEDSQ